MLLVGTASAKLAGRRGRCHLEQKTKATTCGTRTHDLSSPSRALYQLDHTSNQAEHAALGGWIGGLLSRAFHKGHLTVVDRAVGAVAGAGGALLALWLLSWVPAMLLGGPAVEPLAAVLEPLGGRSEILSGLPSVFPGTGATVRDAVGPLAR